MSTRTPDVDGRATLHHLTAEPALPQALPVFRNSDIAIFTTLLALWVSANIIFWIWWLQPEHIVTWPRLVLATVALAYDFTFMPAVFFFFLARMKQPSPVNPPTGLQVAMATAIVPSAESLDVLERTLAAMMQVRYPHDNWVLDEGGDNRVRELCARYGAHYWTRHGRPEFNQPQWPFQAKTKSGNYNSWFHEVAYDTYDFLVQLDTDHAPVPEYLDEILGYFNDPNIAYVAMPSVYWNLDDWTSRASSEQSQVFQGPMQMGYYGWAETPMIIGSHAAYRLEHLRGIGGFAPSRAEDHLDTLKLAQAGHRGVFVSKNLATGLGPHNLSDYLVQEHQWAFSIAQALFKYGRHKGALTFRQRVVFLFSEIWYTWFSMTYLALFLLPIIALLTNKPIISVPFLEFLLYSTPLTAVAILTLAWSYWRGWFKPGTHFFLSWRSMLLVMARWPIVLVALFNATISVLFKGGAFTYMVTPKGARAIRIWDMLRVALPFIVLAGISLGSTVYYVLVTVPNTDRPEAAGYVFFALISAALFTTLVGLALRDFARANRRVGTRRRSVALRSLPLTGIFIALISGLGLSATLNYDHAADALRYWPGVLSEESAVRPDGGAVATSAPTPTPEPTATVAASTEPMTPIASWLADVNRTGVTFGAYDPSGDLRAISGLEHIFIAWTDDGSGGVPLTEVREHYAQGRPVMLSVEPWPLVDMPADRLLSEIASGSYDPVIVSIGQSLAALEHPILVRFGHEMDIPGLYPWGTGHPDEYIAAYRHFVDVVEGEGADNVIWVWSPAGNLDALDYYPGSQYVDYAGTTILEFTGWETDAGFVTPRPISMLIEEKYRLLEPLAKPIILAEVGIALESSLKTERLVELVEVVDRYPLVRAIVYFNNRNPENAASDERPDWSLSTADRNHLEQAIADDDWFEQQVR